MKKYILTNGVIISMDSDRRILFDYDVVIEGGRIEAIVPKGDTPSDEAEILDCDGRIIMPGLIDTGGWAGTKPFSNWMQEYPSYRWPIIRTTLKDSTEEWWKIEGACMATSRLLNGVTTGCVYYDNLLLESDIKLKKNTRTLS